MERIFRYVGIATMKSSYSIIVAACLPVFLLACSKTESENVTSRGIHADIEVSSTSSDSTRVEVELKVGSGIDGTLIELSNGDRLLAHANGITKQLSKDESLVYIKYRTYFDTGAEGTRFRIELNRSENANVPNSTVSLPLVPNITMPANGETIPPNTNLTVAWEPAYTRDSIKIRFITECGGFYEREVNYNPGDIGSFTVNTAELNNLNPERYPDIVNCDLKITVYRRRRGSIDPGYGEGGHITAIQRRDVAVQLQFNPQP
jgi:hypothetical protein